MQQTKFTRKRKLKLLSMVACLLVLSGIMMSSSHREAPLIANDPLADNTDLYAFRSPDHPNKIILIANYVPAELPYGGPNYNSFGENIRYEIHIDNNTATPGDDIIYRFLFKQTNQDPSTFFNTRLGKQNLYTTYTCQKSIDGGQTFNMVVSNGVVPAPNIGPRSISGAAGLGVADYNTLIENSIATATTGERIFCGPADDPFYVDLGGIFDLGDAPRQGGGTRDGLGHYNVHSICIEADIASLQKDHKAVEQAANILDGNFVIGVWASSSRRATRTLNSAAGGSPFNPTGGGTITEEGNWVQVSRIGMPLTNEAVVALGRKDFWNALTPYQDLANLNIFGNYFYNPELALYMDQSKFASAVPAFNALRVQSNSLGQFDFRNTRNGLYGLKGTSSVTGTALDDAIFGSLLLPGPGKPRSVDLYPIFHTGVPNLSPYQLAIGKNGNPLAAGKPFINNFLPNGGDMLRLNMAVPPTMRNDPKFSSLGLVQAAVLGLTDPAYNGSAMLQPIPNMDGFPNGRRLEDDVTRIELQAVGGVVLAAIGLWYDDFSLGGSPLTNQLKNTLQYSTGVEKNDTTFKPAFPYVQTPWRGTAVQ